MASVVDSADVADVYQNGAGWHGRRTLHPKTRASVNLPEGEPTAVVPSELRLARAHAGGPAGDCITKRSGVCYFALG